MRVAGDGEGLFLKCLTDKNWFHIRIEDPETHEYISRVSGFRKGNSVFLNQLRCSNNLSKYTNENLQEFIKVYAKSLIEDTKDSEYPIENVFINTDYAMSSDKSDKIYFFGEGIKEGYNLNDIKDYCLRDSMNIWADVCNEAILLATTEEGRKTKNGYVPFKGGIENAGVYDAVRDKIYGLEYDENTLKHQFVTVDTHLLMEKINRVHAMKEKLLGSDYRYEIEDVIYSSDDILDGYASSDFYVYIDSNYNIHSDCIEFVNKNNEVVPYGQKDKAINEMNKYIEILKNRYKEVHHVI